MTSQPIAEAAKQAFAGIPAAELLAIAAGVQAELKAGREQTQEKQGGELVSRADVQIQAQLLTYFAESALRGRYRIRAEETIESEFSDSDTQGAECLLVIDPLDGTSAFCRGENTWGTMIGLCGLNGELLTSWCLLSTGKIYSSVTAQTQAAPPVWDQAIETGRSLTIDVYDYGAGAAERFPQALQSASGGRIPPAQITTVSTTAAAWAGWQLYNGKLDGLLWLPSALGKGTYPDYDLSFLDALAVQGWSIALGRRGSSVELVAAADSEANRELLLQAAAILVPGSAGLTIETSSPFTITSPYEGLQS